MFLIEIHIRNTGCRFLLPYVWDHSVTHYYVPVPPDTSEHSRPLPQPVKAGTRFTYPGGMEG